MWQHCNRYKRISKCPLTGPARRSSLHLQSLWYFSSLIFFLSNLLYKCKLHFHLVTEKHVAIFFFPGLFNNFMFRKFSQNLFLPNFHVWIEISFFLGDIWLHEYLNLKILFLIPSNLKIIYVLCLLLFYS